MENVQEIAQNTLDLMIKYTANLVSSSGKIDATMSAEDILNTIVLTTLTTWLVSVKGTLNNVQAESDVYNVLTEIGNDPSKIESFQKFLEKNKGQEIWTGAKKFTITDQFIQEVNDHFSWTSVDAGQKIHIDPETIQSNEMIEKNFINDKWENLLDQIKSPEVKKEMLTIMQDNIANGMLDIENGKAYVEVNGQKVESKLFNETTKHFWKEQAMLTRLQVRTQNFKNRFGDWQNNPENASKVVDENWEPMVVYHWTSRNFEQFKDKDWTWRYKNTWYHFSSDHETILEYSEKWWNVVESTIWLISTELLWTNNITNDNMEIFNKTVNDIIKNWKNSEFYIDWKNPYVNFVFNWKSIPIRVSEFIEMFDWDLPTEGTAPYIKVKDNLVPIRISPFALNGIVLSLFLNIKNPHNLELSGNNTDFLDADYSKIEDAKQNDQSIDWGIVNSSLWETFYSIFDPKNIKSAINNDWYFNDASPKFVWEKKSTVDPEVVKKNSLLADWPRLTEAEKLLPWRKGVLIDQNGKPTPLWQKILDAHNNSKGWEIYDLTPEQLREKVQILKNAGFTSDEVRILIENGICGKVEIEVLDINQDGVSEGSDAILEEAALLEEEIDMLENIDDNTPPAEVVKKLATIKERVKKLVDYIKDETKSLKTDIKEREMFLHKMDVVLEKMINILEHITKIFSVHEETVLACESIKLLLWTYMEIRMGMVKDVAVEGKDGKNVKVAKTEIVSEKVKKTYDEIASALQKKIEAGIDVEKNRYILASMKNLSETSRTAKWVLDASASENKQFKFENISPEDAWIKALENFQKLSEYIYENRNMQFVSVEEVKAFIENISKKTNEWILKPEYFMRDENPSLDEATGKPKYAYTDKDGVQRTFDQFCEEFYNKLQDTNIDPLELSAWVEYRVNIKDHFFADGCGKTSILLSNFILMRNNISLPEIRWEGKERFKYSWKTQRDPNRPEYNPDLEIRTEYYKTQFIKNEIGKITDVDWIINYIEVYNKNNVIPQGNEMMIDNKNWWYIYITKDGVLKYQRIEDYVMEKVKLCKDPAEIDEFIKKYNDKTPAKSKEMVLGIKDEYCIIRNDKNWEIKKVRINESKVEKTVEFTKMSWKEILEYAIENTDLIIQKYQKSQKIGEEFVVDVDGFRKFLWADEKVDAQLTHEWASYLADYYIDWIVENNKELVGKNFTIRFIWWWAGSGKSLVSKFSPNEVYNGVWDGTMKTYDNAKIKIDKAVEKWYNVQIDFVFRNMNDAWNNGVLKRTIEQNLWTRIDNIQDIIDGKYDDMLGNINYIWRTLPLSAFKGWHMWARTTFARLYTEGYHKNMTFYSGDGKIEFKDFIDLHKNDFFDEDIAKQNTELIFKKWFISEQQYHELLGTDKK